MNLALIRIPKSGSTTIADNLESFRLSGEHPCLVRGHHGTDVFADHGHSHDLITMVRDPLQQYISAYYYIKHVRSQVVRAEGQRTNILRPLADVIDATDSLEEYLLNAPTGEFAVRYFGPIQASDFFFIGETNRMPESLAVLGSMLGFTPTVEWSNRNPGRPESLQPYWVPDDVAAAFRLRNEAEYELYAKGVERFEYLKGVYL